MNLLNRSLNYYDHSNILYFREYQYELINPFIDLCLEYLKNLGLEVDPNYYKKELIEDINYHSINHFSCKIIKIRINDNIKEPFLNLTIPKLIDGTFFKLNGVYYIPGFYIVDEPITVKKNSSILSSLFTPITLYTKENRAIILGNNIPLARLFRLYYSEGEIQDLAELLQFEYLPEKLEISVLQLADKFACIPDLENVRTKLEQLFFDPWTKELYCTYYNIKEEEISLKRIFDQLIINYQQKQDRIFINLKYKRLVFTEFLLAPLFKSVSLAIPSILKGIQLYKLNIGLGDLVDHFYNKLNRFNLYDSVNGYSGLLTLKATFSNPSSNSELPSCVTSIHNSYKGKIDPISISNTDPGKNISLIPNQKIDLKYGIFLDD
jgi:hypothetical protein